MNNVFELAWQAPLRPGHTHSNTLAAMTQYSVLVLPMIALAMLIFFPHSNKNSKISTSWKSRRKRKVFLWRLTLAVLLIATVITLAWRWDGYIISLTQGVILSAAVLVPAFVINALVSLVYRGQRVDLTGNSDSANSNSANSNSANSNSANSNSANSNSANSNSANSNSSSSDAFSNVADSNYITRGKSAIRDDKLHASDQPENKESLVSAQTTTNAKARITESNVTTNSNQFVGRKKTQGAIVSNAATKVAATPFIAREVNVQQAVPKERVATTADQIDIQLHKENEAGESTSKLNAGVRPTPTPTPTPTPASQQRVKRRTATSNTQITSLHESASLNPDFDNVEITLFEEDEDSPAEVQEQLNKLSDAVQSHDLSDWKESLTKGNTNWKDIRDSHDRQTALSTDLITSVSTTTDISKLDSQEINQLVTTLTKDKLRLQKLVIAQQAAIESERQSHDQSRTVARDAIRIMRDARDAQKMAEKLARRERTERKRIEQQYKSVASALDNALSIIETRKQQSQADSA